jgi:hypothetical protein
MWWLSELNSSCSSMSPHIEIGLAVQWILLIRHSPKEKNTQNIIGPYTVLSDSLTSFGCTVFKAEINIYVSDSTDIVNKIIFALWTLQWKQWDYWLLSLHCRWLGLLSDLPKQWCLNLSAWGDRKLIHIRKSVQWKCDKSSTSEIPVNVYRPTLMTERKLI